METLMLVLLMAINTIDPSMKIPDKLPKVEYRTECQLFSYHDGKPCPKNLHEVRRTFAIYETANDTILLPDTFDPNDMVHVSVLLHELVHFVQDQDGEVLLKTLQGMCVAEAWEKNAYRIQFEWMERRGIDPYQATGLNPITLKMLTSCGGNRYEQGS